MFFFRLLPLGITTEDHVPPFHRILCIYSRHTNNLNVLSHHFSQGTCQCQAPVLRITSLYDDSGAHNLRSTANIQNQPNKYPPLYIVPE